VSVGVTFLLFAEQASSAVHVESGASFSTHLLHLGTLDPKTALWPLEQGVIMSMLRVRGTILDILPE
jgi:hypothetical protein